MAIVKWGICLTTRDVEDCDGNIRTVQGLPVFIENIVNTKDCEQSVWDWEVTCISDDGWLTIVSWLVVYDMRDPQNPAETIYFNWVDVTATYEKVPCDKNIDNEEVDICRIVTAAGAWWAVWDKITITRIFETTSPTEPLYLYSFLTNATSWLNLTWVVTEIDVLDNTRECDTVVCSSWVASGYADDLSWVIPFNSIWITKPVCCEVTIVTSAWTFVIPKGKHWIDLNNFKCLVDLVSVSTMWVGWADCSADIHIMLQSY